MSEENETKCISNKSPKDSRLVYVLIEKNKRLTENRLMSRLRGCNSRIFVSGQVIDCMYGSTVTDTGSMNSMVY